MRSQTHAVIGIAAAFVLALGLGSGAGQAAAPSAAMAQAATPGQQHGRAPAAPEALNGSAFTYQGQLRKNGLPVNGMCNAEFMLYDEATGGAQIGGTVTSGTLQVIGGRFTIPLDFGASAFNGDARWLETSIGCDEAPVVLDPRTELQPAPYATFSMAPWATVAGGLSYSGNVGVGTASPQAALNVSGTAWFQGDTTPLPAAAGKGIGIGFGGEQGYIFGFDYDTFTPMNLLLQNPGGRVGIGTVTPTGGRLHVEGGSLAAVYGNASSAAGVVGYSGANVGVYGFSTSVYGVDGRSNSQIGVYGQSYASFSAGVYGLSPYIGTQGIVNGNDSGRQAIRGDNYGSATGYAGLFNGNTWTVGTLYKNSGAFRIDHPLDPANKYLSHSFVESPDMKNIYDGVVMTDAKGLAVVELPAWFEALNRDFRYQLTVMGQFAQAIVAKEIEKNTFTIQTDKPKVKVSWQVTGIRQDPYAKDRPIVVEEDKPASLRGKYVYPEGYGQPREKSAAALPTAGR